MIGISLVYFFSCSSYKKVFRHFRLTSFLISFLISSLTLHFDILFDVFLDIPVRIPIDVLGMSFRFLS